MNEIENRPLKKRIIILDINGLLVDVVSPHPKDHKADITIEGRTNKNCFVLCFYKSSLFLC